MSLSISDNEWWDASKSLYEVICHKWLHKDDICIIYQEKKYLFSDIAYQVEKLVASFLQSGMKKLSKVMILINNPLDYVIIMLSLLKFEAIPMPIYTQTGIDKVEQMASKYCVNFIIADNHINKWSCNSVKQVWTEPNFQLLSLSKVIDTKLEGVRLMPFTSGTTNLPKAIMLTHSNVVSNIVSISKYLKVNECDRLFLMKNLNHCSTIVGELFVGLYNKCKIIFTAKLLTPKSLVSTIKNYKVSVFFAVPTILKEILLYRERENFELDMLRTINFYGSPITSEDLKRIIMSFPNINFIYSYGQTEASPRVTYIESPQLQKQLKSSGKAIDGVKIRISDCTGKTVPYGEKGEIVVSGPNVMRGYYMDEINTNKAIKNGELYTGDIGHMNEEGFLFVCGRYDNMILSAGKNIYLEEIEAVLTSYYAVKEAYVEAQKQENHTQKIYGYIVVKDCFDIIMNELYLYCKNHLEIYKVPNEIFIVPALKKTPSGKISRNQTR